MKESKSIAIFNKDLELYKSFESVTMCGKFFGVSPSSFNSVLRTKRRMYKKTYFVFTHEEVLNGLPKKTVEYIKQKEKEKLDLNVALSLLPTKRELTRTALIGVSMSKREITEYASITEAANQCKTNKGSVFQSVSEPFKRKAKELYFFKNTFGAKRKIERLFQILDDKKSLNNELKELFPNIPEKKFM